MTRTSGGTALRTIFSFFLGLMLTAFVGVGVYTFHGPPEQFEDQIRDLNRREQSIRNLTPEDELTTADRQQIEEIRSERNRLTDAAAEALVPWGRSTSIVLVVFATLVMALSLIRSDQLPVISNGLLLGGVFTMLYGVGWIIATDSSVARFLVMTMALAITLTLGYVRFVRRGAVSGVGAGPQSWSGDGLEDIERRLADLEERMSGAADALGPREGRRGGNQ
jgi:hypothetical protein